MKRIIGGIQQIKMISVFCQANHTVRFIAEKFYAKPIG